MYPLFTRTEGGFTGGRRDTNLFSLTKDAPLNIMTLNE